MREKEIQLFTKAMQLATDEFYLDAIGILNQLVDEFPESELVDDAYYDIGLCYFNMNQFQTAIEIFQKVINEFPEATISVLIGDKEYGKTAAKCYYALMNCYLGLNDRRNALAMIEELSNYKDSYIINSLGDKIIFKELSVMAYKLFTKNCNNTGYYIYINWTAKDKTANKIHHSSCGNCRMGFGKHKDAGRGEHGVWIGPFTNRKLAEDFSQKFFSEYIVQNCQHCNKK